MSRNGSGVYSPPGSSFPAVFDTTVDETKYNNVINDIASALTDSIAKDGQTTITANIPMSNHKFTGMLVGSVSSDSCTLGQAAQATILCWCGTATGTANALTLTPAIAITAYAAGQSFIFKAGASPNSGATTINVSGVGAIALQKNGAACAGGEISANQWYEVVLDSATTAQLRQFKILVAGTDYAAPGANTDITSLQSTTTVTTQAAGNNTTRIASTAFVQGEKKVIQVVNTQTGAVNSGTTIMPDDDTIPQNTEGVEFMTLSVTPTSAANKLKIDVVAYLSTNTAVRYISGALFQDSTANALASGIIFSCLSSG